MNDEEKVIMDSLIQLVKRNKIIPVSVLASIKSRLRTKKVVDFIFDHPDIFTLAKEIHYVPEKLLDKGIYIKLVLACPEEFAMLDEFYIYQPEEGEISPIFIAFLASKKRRGLDLPVPINYSSQLEEAEAVLDELDIVNKLAQYYDLQFSREASKIIIDWYRKTYERQPITFPLNGRKLAILVSGIKGVGKEELAERLVDRIASATKLSEDELFERELIDTPLSEIIDEQTQAVIFTSEMAYNFFGEAELANFLVTNVVVKPESISAFFKYAKENEDNFSMDEFHKRIRGAYSYSHLANPIEVANDFAGNLDEQADLVILEIEARLQRIGFDERQEQKSDKVIKLDQN